MIVKVLGTWDKPEPTGLELKIALKYYLKDLTCSSASKYAMVNIFICLGIVLVKFPCIQT